MKFCRGCSESNEEVEFVKGRRWCVTCYKAYCKEYDKSNKKSAIKTCSKCGFVGGDELFRENRSVCKVCNALYHKNYIVQWNADNKEERKEKIKEYREKHKAEMKIWHKQWYLNNKEERDKLSKKWYSDNKEKVRKQVKAYRKNNIEKYLHQGAKKRAKIKNIPFTITIQDIIDVMPKDNICHLLNIEMVLNDGKLGYNSFTLDKIDPVKGYIPLGIQVISYKANTSKSDSTLLEYSKIVNNLKNIINNRNLIFENGGNWNVNLKHNLQLLKSRTMKRNLPKSDVTLGFLNKIYPIDDRCALCKNKMIKGKGHVQPNSPSLDRIIPVLGYQQNNIMWICHRCNIIKGSLSLKEMQLLLSNWEKQLI